MDEKVTLSAQLEENVSSVILLNTFTIKPEDVDEFLKVFSTTTEFFKQQPGFISASVAQRYCWQFHILQSCSLGICRAF